MKGTERSSKKPNKYPVVVCDFDDTTVVENVAELLLLEFGDGKWLDYRRQHSMQLISLKDYQELAFSTVKVSRDMMKSAVTERVTLRPHFKALFNYCRDTKVPLVIASMGLDFYIEAVLEREDMTSIPYFAVDTKFTSSGINFDYRFPWDGCWQSGNCKCRVLEQYRRQNYPILFAGDGKSDICPASKADLVFAHRHLAQHRQRNGLTYTELTDFSPVLESVKRLTNFYSDEGPQ